MISRDMTGKRVKTVAVTNGRIVRRHKAAREFRVLLEGRTVKTAQRLGKNLVFGLDNGSHLIIHLGMSGQLLRGGPKIPKPKHTHVVITMATGEEIRYVDPRTFGELYVSTPPAAGAEITMSPLARLSVGGDGVAIRRVVPELAHLGIDPFEDQIGWDRLAAILRSHSLALKTFLTDQDIIAGIGNIYADEICFAAGLRYDRPSDSLSVIEIRRLHRAITEILTDAIKHGGSTLADEQFVNPAGEPGRYQNFHAVHAREGQPCKECRTPIEKVTFHQRSTYFCPKDQH
jgi:formamidopyrimidine-DNA glycosylase